MKKTTLVSAQAPTPTGMAERSATRTKTPKLKRKASLEAPRRQNMPEPGSPKNGTRKNGDQEDQLDVEQVLAALDAIKKGNFSTRLPVAWTGMAGKVADSFNEVAEMMSNSTEELSRISRVVGKEGRIQERLSIGHVS